jgi:hypothetical protein
MGWRTDTSFATRGGGGGGSGVPIDVSTSEGVNNVGDEAPDRMISDGEKIGGKVGGFEVAT